MSSLIHLIQDLLPMILPSTVQIVRGADVPTIAARSRPAFDPPQSDSGPATPGGPIRLVDEEARGSPGGPGPDGQAGTDAPRNLGGAGIDAEAGLDGGASTERRAGAEVLPRPPRPPRVVRQDAVVGLTDKMCATVITAGPSSATPVHHNGEQDAMIYAISGHGLLLTSPPDDDLVPPRSPHRGAQDPAASRKPPAAQPRRHPLAPGDFAVVPAWTEHQLANEGAEGDAVWLVVQSGGAPVGVDLVDWGGPRLEDHGARKG